MKKIFTISLLAPLALSLWVCAFAGIGPTLGLPTVNVSTANNQKWNQIGLTNTAVTMNNGSVMCVDCHTRNPSTHASPSNFPGGSFSYNFLGSHFVTSTFADTNTGGGYPGAVSGIRATNDYYVKRDQAWPATGRMSKYGRNVSGSLLSDNTTGAGATGRQIICESCHNITRNWGRYKLLGKIDNASLAGDSNLCAGCHGDMRQGLNNEPSFFDNTTPGNQHHRHYQPEAVYGGALAPLDASHTSELISNTAGYYGAVGVGPSKLWAASFGQLTGLARNAVYTSATNPGIKNVTGAADWGMIHVDNSASLYCLSCHRAHNAFSGWSGLNLRTSDNTLALYGGSSTWGGSAIPTSNSPSTGDTWRALRRQNDFGDPTVFTNRLIRDDRPLCNGCHVNR
jgi:hypothetical protein